MVGSSVDSANSLSGSIVSVISASTLVPDIAPVVISCVTPAETTIVSTVAMDVLVI